VCVSDALVEEVKRIIKDSEILKYALGLPDYLEGDVLISNPDLQLLASVLVLLGPLGVILPRCGNHLMLSCIDRQDRLAGRRDRV
jgi:hypothetical protein